MTEQGKDGAQGWFASTPVRVGGVAVLLVLAEVAARARASGGLPHVSGPPGGLVIGIIRTIGIAVLASGLVLLLWGRRLDRLKIVATKERKKQLSKLQRKRMIIAVSVGLLVGLVYQIILRLLGPPDSQRPPPPEQSGAPQQNGNGLIDQTQAHPPGEAGIGTYVTALLALLALIALGIVVLRRVQVVEVEAEDEDEDEESEAVTRAVVAGQAAVQDRAITDPREAIVACFAAMERALAGVGPAAAPKEADTPQEVLRRGAEASELPEEPAAQLLDLFQEARFSTHPMRQDDREAADRALTAILTSLGARHGVTR